MKSVITFLILLILLSCSRDKVDYLGPAYISAPDGFAVTGFTATPSPVDFTAGSVSFNANFTDNVTWILTMTGQTSGATYKIQETSKGLSNIQWTGKNDGLIFFRSGETVTATLTFYGTTLTSSIPVVITKAPDYSTCGVFPQYGDFEDTTHIYSQVYWHAFNKPTPIPNVVQGVDSMAIDYNGNLVPSIQGKKYYFIKGLGAQSVFVSGVQYTGPELPAIPADPSKVWVNIFIYGTGDANAQVELDYQESDNAKSANYQPAVDDAYEALITLDHKGWKLFSFQYSQLTISTNPAFGGSGNKIQEPQNLRSFDLVLLKESNPTSPVEVYFDYPIITIGGPFKPCK